MNINNNEITLNSWKDFPDALDQLREKYGKWDSSQGKEKNEILFRGQADYSWPLETTLERHVSKNMPIVEYYKRISFCKAEIETLTGHKWAFPSWDEINGLFQKNERASIALPRLPLPAYDYFVYLRHHGFPSPLLDWSKSPYIAAYFAFSENRSSKYVTVWCFVKSADPTRFTCPIVGDGFIRVMTSHVRGHRRHFTQKAKYTIALSNDREFNVYFSSHDGALSCQGKLEDEDILIKINIPTIDRSLALENMEDFNINHYTLFETEDALIKTLSIRWLTMSRI